MSGIKDTATVTLNVNGAQAKQMMSELEAKIKQTEDKITSLKANMADPKDVEKARKQLRTYQKQLDEMKSATEGVDKALGNLDVATPRQLEKALRTLNRQLKDMTPGTEVWNSHVEKIQELKSRLSELRDELSEQESAWTRFKDWSVTAWPAIDLLRQGYETVVGGMRDYVDAYADMEQEMANVRKFTGMTEEQVASLNEEFKKIDTRSSREQLNKLAQEAGRLGKTSEEDVLGFVRAADKINVALDDLGDGATLILSKLTGIFGAEERYGTEQALLKVGSVINELSQNCSASAPYLTNFTERMGGVGTQAGMTIQQIMGFGAVLDANALKVEASATALSQVIVRLYQDPAKYAKVAGLEVESFSRLMREDANSAILLFLETLQKAGGMDVLSPMFKDMGENGSRAITALSTLATHIDQVKAQQEAANVAFSEGTSIDKEFAVQNETVQASIEKAQKRFQELRIELGEKLTPLMRYVFTSGSALAKAMSFLVDVIYKNRTAIVSIAAVIATYYAWLGLCKVATVAWSAVTKAAIVVQNAFRVAVALSKVAVIAFTGGLTKARHAFQLLNTVIKANPIGLLLSALTAVFLIIKKLIPATDEYTKKLRDSVAIASSYNEELEKEQRELDKLFGALEGAAEGSKEFLDAKKKLLSQYGAYLEGLMTEEGKILDLEAAYKRLSEAIRIANEERGIEEARKAVDDTYFEKMNDLQKQLSVSLVAYGADQREAVRLAMQVSTAMSSNRQLSDATIARLNELSKNSPKEGLDEGFITGFLASISPGSQNSSIGELFGVDQIPQPVTVVNSMYDAKNLRNTALNEVDIIQRQQRPYGEIQDNMLESLINYAEDAVANGGGSVLKVADALAGTVEFVQVSADEATQLLEQLKGEQAYRNGAAASNSNATVIEPDAPEPPENPDKTDRFAEEKAWRERQEAEARIDYATGETTFAEHTARMSAIATDYFQMLLDREDLSADERLSIQADYWEAVNKEVIAGNKLLLDEEDRNYQDLLDRLRSNHLARLNQEGLSAEERQHEAEYYAEVRETAELQHLQNIRDLYEEGSDEWLAADRKFQERQLAARERHLKRMEDLERTYSSMKAKYFGDNPEERQAKYDKDFAALQVVYARELAAAGDNAAERLRIEEAFLQAQNALRRQYGLESEEDTRNSMERAVASSVEWLNGDGGKALTGTISTLTSGMSSIFSGLSSMIQAELEIQTSKIEKRYDREIEMVQGNSYKVAKLEKKKEADIAKAKNEANRKMFAMQVIQAVAQTAQNALSAYGSAAAIPVVGYILAPIAAAMAVAAGAIQIASIKKQQQASQAQGYSQGGFTKSGAVDEPAGVVHAGEWVASQKLLANPVARPMIDALDYAQRTNTIGSLRPEDVSRSITANNSLVRIAEGDNGSALMVAAAVQMSHTVDNLTDRLNEPFVTVNTVTGDKGIKQAQDEYSRLMDNVTPKSKRKK